MNTVFTKSEIEKYAEIAYECSNKCMIEICGDIDENAREQAIADFEENAVYSGNCFDGFFEQINSCRCDNKLFVELQKLGDYDGFYQDWSMKKYMQTMRDICETLDNVWISNYGYVEDEPALRAFFISFLFDINEIKYYEEVYQYCHEFCEHLDSLTRRKLTGCYWDAKYEIDEMEFCKMYLTPLFKNMGFEQVIFNHGNKEFGKDYILVTKNIFGKTEYYGVQAKAGNMSGAATSNINEIVSQINMGFTIPYKLTDGKEIFISKMIIAISGIFTDNAKNVIQRFIDEYKFANIIFLSKKELENYTIIK